MEIYGYKKRKDNNLYGRSMSLRETSIACSLNELLEIVKFVEDVYASNHDYSFPYGPVTRQFRDWSKTWKKGDPDFVLVIKPPEQV